MIVSHIARIPVKKILPHLVGNCLLNKIFGRGSIIGKKRRVIKVEEQGEAEEKKDYRCKKERAHFVLHNRFKRAKGKAGNLIGIDTKPTPFA